MRSKRAKCSSAYDTASSVLSTLTSGDIKTRARALGFDLCGVAPAAALPELAFLRRWLDRGYAGQMGYLKRTAERRSDARRVLPTAKTVVALGTIYNVDRSYSTESVTSDQAHVARYAWGEDYHKTIGKRTAALLDWMQATSLVPFDAKAYVDTGPVQERVYAQHAGLGWIGKNTCVINQNLGSWLFLSEILCSLPLDTDAPALDQCGTCTLCLEACPTGAIIEPWVLDATRCISYLTIELKDEIPEPLREPVGTHVYGCDVCQEVCPWNTQAAQSTDPAWQPDPVLDQPKVADLWRQPDEVLRPVVKGSAMARAGLRGVRRNIAVALGNSETSATVEALLEPVPDDSRSDPLVARHLSWSRRRRQTGIA